MQTEIEVKFLDVNFDELREKLIELGGGCEQPMRLMRRAIIETETMKANDAYLRVRDEGDKVTMTYKQFRSLSVDGAQEIEMTVGDFDTAIAMLSAIDLPYRSLQESKRETWKLGDVEVVLDEWPWLKPYIEIEGGSEADLQTAAAELGLDWKMAVFGDVMVAYRAEYPHLTEKDTVGNIAEVRFDDPLPDLLKA